MKRIVLDLTDGEAEKLLSQSNYRDDEGRPVLNSLRSANNEGVEAVVVEEGYIVENLEEKLRTLRDSIQSLLDSKISMTLLEAFVRSKGISQRDFNKVLYAINEFFRQIK